MKTSTGYERDFLGQFPLGLVDQPLVLTADPDVFGKIHVGTIGTGFYYGEFSAVPEPTSNLLFLFGLFLAWLRRYRCFWSH